MFRKKKGEELWAAEMKTKAVEEKKSIEHQKMVPESVFRKTKRMEAWAAEKKTQAEKKSTDKCK